jgi:hypothetical protein
LLFNWFSGAAAEGKEGDRHHRHLLADLKEDYFDKLVAIPAPLARLRKKAASLPQEKYYPQLFDLEPFRDWIRRTTIGSQSKLSTPPISFTCGELALTLPPGIELLVHGHSARTHTHTHTHTHTLLISLTPPLLTLTPKPPIARHHLNQLVSSKHI